MKKKRFFSVEQIVSVLKEADLGTPVAELIRKVRISRQTFYQWKRVDGGLEPGEAAEAYEVSEQRACALAMFSRSLYRYENRRDPRTELARISATSPECACPTAARDIGIIPSNLLIMTRRSMKIWQRQFRLRCCLSAAHEAVHFCERSVATRDER